MAVNCAACDDLRETSPEFVTKGVTETVCTSLKNNTGLNPALDVLHDDEEDLNNVADCLIGNMTDEVEAYDVCDWKEFTRRLIPNIYNTIKALICSVIGLWQTIDCVKQMMIDYSNIRDFCLQSNVVYYDGFSNRGSSNGFAISYCNLHSYQYVNVTSAKVTELHQADNLFTNKSFTGIYGEAINGIPICRATGRISEHNLVRIEETMTISTGGQFIIQNTQHTNPNNPDETTVYLSIRARIVPPSDAVDELAQSQLSIVLNAPVEVKFGITGC